MLERSNNRYYDASYKISVCEEYLQLLKDNPKLSKRKYADSKDIKHTTFQDWITAYLAHKKDNDDDLITTSPSEAVSVPKFIEISDIEPINNNNQSFSSFSNNKVTLKYKDVSLEFDSSDIGKALEIIKRW